MAPATPYPQAKETGVTLDAIRAWRHEREAAGLPHSLRLYFEARNLCYRCHGRGVHLSWDQRREETCIVCDGDGIGLREDSK